LVEYISRLGCESKEYSIRWFSTWFSSLYGTTTYGSCSRTHRSRSIAYVSLSLSSLSLSLSMFHITHTHTTTHTVDLKTHFGASILISICSSEDVELSVLRLLISHVSSTTVNYRRNATTLKCKMLTSLSRTLVRLHLAHNSGVIYMIANESGSNALHAAVQRGDVDVVNLLLENGADPTIQNHLGLSSIDICKGYPEMRGGLKRVTFLKRTATNRTITLNRRNSTATRLLFPMYLISLFRLRAMYVFLFLFTCSLFPLLV
jgi:hypothetical protein